MPMKQKEVEKNEMWSCAKCDSHEIHEIVPKFMPDMMCSECGKKITRSKLRGCRWIEVKNDIPAGTILWFTVDEWHKLSLPRPMHMTAHLIPGNKKKNKEDKELYHVKIGEEIPVVT